jgi:hypothetical protein
MRPLEVRAHIRGALCMPDRPVMLDALLAYAVAMRDGVQPALTRREVVPIEIPVARSECGRFHLASAGHCAIDETELRWLNRRFPTTEAQVMAGPKLRRINITAGLTKSYRIPLATFHAVDDVVTWWCVGERAEVESLLGLVSYVGKKRAVGLGAVRQWEVAEVAPWLGFPVLRDGMPLRPLPDDVSGVSADADRGMSCITYPYWRRHEEQPCFVPLTMC